MHFVVLFGVFVVKIEPVKTATVMFIRVRDSLTIQLRFGGLTREASGFEGDLCASCFSFSVGSTEHNFV